MKKRAWALIGVFVLFFLLSPLYARGLVYFGIQAGYSAQKPSLKEVEFTTDTTFVYGISAGVKFLMLGLEVNYLQAAHNLNLKDFLLLDWDGREVDYNFLGLNLKCFFPILMIHPYLTFGYGYYAADIKEVGEDKKSGFNLGLGVEVMLGKKFSLTAEGKYHHVGLDIQKRKLGLGNFIICGGLGFHF